jgi:hypothetical protein
MRLANGFPLQPRMEFFRADEVGSLSIAHFKKYAACIHP